MKYEWFRVVFNTDDEEKICQLYVNKKVQHYSQPYSVKVRFGEFLYSQASSRFLTVEKKKNKNDTPVFIQKKTTMKIYFIISAKMNFFIVKICGNKNLGFTSLLIYIKTADDQIFNGKTCFDGNFLFYFA